MVTICSFTPQNREPTSHSNATAQSPSLVKAVPVGKKASRKVRPGRELDAAGGAAGGAVGGCGCGSITTTNSNI